jgi:hypothetical protein
MKWSAPFPVAFCAIPIGCGAISFRLVDTAGFGVITI